MFLTCTGKAESWHVYKTQDRPVIIVVVSLWLCGTSCAPRYMQSRSQALSFCSAAGEKMCSSPPVGSLMSLLAAQTDRGVHSI